MSRPPLSPSAQLLARYDRHRRCFDLPMDGRLRAVLAAAHQRGHRGAGKRIAILDSGFDLTIPALADASGGRLTAHRPSAPHPHGTAVALLALEAAPEAALDLHSVSDGGAIDPAALAAAIAAAAETADILCLSLGAGVRRADVRLHPLDTAGGVVAAFDALLAADGAVRREVTACPLVPCACDAARHVRGPLIFAASGNDDDMLFCPALADPVISVGFGADDRQPGADGAETAQQAKPDYAQSSWTDIQLPQPPGVYGSSFAAPLMAGVAALGTPAADWPALIAAGRLAGDAARLQVLATHGQLPDAMIGWMMAMFDRALTILPQHGSIAAGRHWCAGSALLTTSLFVNAGLAQLAARRDADGAERLLRAALHLDSGHPDAMANLAATLLFRAEHGEHPRNNAQQAASLWTTASAARPGFRGYDKALARAQALAAQSD